MQPSPSCLLARRGRAALTALYKVTFCSDFLPRKLVFLFNPSDFLPGKSYFGIYAAAYQVYCTSI